MQRRTLRGPAALLGTAGLLTLGLHRPRRVAEAGS
jgi:hypothetical protein